MVTEWHAKADDLSAELNTSQTEMRNYSSEIFRMKAEWEEVVEQLEVVKRENKNLTDEIKDLLDQVIIKISNSKLGNVIWIKY